MNVKKYYNEADEVVFLLSNSNGLGWASIFPSGSIENEILMFDFHIVELYFAKASFKDVMFYLESLNVLIVDEGMMSYSWESVIHQTVKPGEVIYVHTEDGKESIKHPQDFYFITV